MCNVQLYPIGDTQQMSEYMWKKLRSTNPETSKDQLRLALSVAQNNYRALRCQDFHFWNFVTCILQCKAQSINMQFVYFSMHKYFLFINQMGNFEFFT